MLHIRSISLPQSKEKWMDSGFGGLGLSLDVLIYNKVWKTQIVMFVSLMFWVRCSCIYTWVNLNLKLCSLEVLHVIWIIHFSFY